MPLLLIFLPIEGYGITQGAPPVAGGIHASIKYPSRAKGGLQAFDPAHTYATARPNIRIASG